VTEIRTVRACTACQVSWSPDRERAKCTDPARELQDFEVHLHRTPVVLPDGTSVTAVSFDPLAPYAREHPPHFGLYLDAAWAPPWPHEHVAWPDFGVPEDPTELQHGLGTLWDRAHRGESVELGCLGGHGRTGTALACLAVLAGHPADDAVRWVRQAYCPGAVETAAQESFVRRWGEAVGRPDLS